MSDTQANASSLYIICQHLQHVRDVQNIHRPNFRTHHGCMGVWGKKSPTPEISASREKRNTDFLLYAMKFGQQCTAARQISPTRYRFEFLARCGAGGGQNAAVGRFKRSYAFLVRKATQQHTHSSKYTTKENA